MPISPVCRSCLQALRRQVKRVPLEARTISQLSLSAQSSTIPRRTVVRPSRPAPHASIIRHAYATSTSTPAPISAPPPSSDGLSEDDPTAARVAQAMQEQEADFTETYVANAATETLFKECARQADYIVPEVFERDGEVPKTAAGEDLGKGTGFWYEGLELTPTFSTWAQVTMLHMYLLTVRLRYFPPSYSGIWMQHLTDHFFFEAEHRMTIFHSIQSRMIRNRYLKGLYDQWRGVQAAYDEGLIRGDAVLAAAVWRNIFQGKDDVDWARAALVVSFMRRGLKALDGASDKTIIGGLIKFGSPLNELGRVEEPSVEMARPFTKEDDEAVEKLLQELKEMKK